MGYPGDVEFDTWIHGCGDGKADPVSGSRGWSFSVDVSRDLPGLWRRDTRTVNWDRPSHNPQNPLIMVKTPRGEGIVSTPRSTLKMEIQKR